MGEARWRRHGTVSVLRRGSRRGRIGAGNCAGRHLGGDLMMGSSTVLAVAVTVAALVGASPASADRSRPVPDPATIRLTGNGYGHGKGMSQYGAYGAAGKGLTFRQILS